MTLKNKRISRFFISLALSLVLCVGIGFFVFTGTFFEVTRSDKNISASYFIFLYSLWVIIFASFGTTFNALCSCGDIGKKDRLYLLFAALIPLAVHYIALMQFPLFMLAMTAITISLIFSIKLIFALWKIDKKIIIFYTPFFMGQALTFCFNALMCLIDLFPPYPS